MLESTLQNSVDYTQYNTCDEYMQTARTHVDKISPVRQTMETAVTNPNDQGSIQSSIDYSRGPRTSRDHTDRPIKKGSVDVGGNLFQSRHSRQHTNVTTAPMSYNPRRKPSVAVNQTPFDFDLPSGIGGDRPSSFGLSIPPPTTQHTQRARILQGQTLNIDI